MSQKKHTLFLYTKAFLQNQDILYDSILINKYINKLMLAGRKHLTEKYAYYAFMDLKFLFKRLPSGLLINKLVKFRPVLSHVLKRMGRRYNAIPIPINARRQVILSLRYIVKYTQNTTSRNFNLKIVEALTEILSSKKNSITKKIAEEIKYLTDARMYMHLRWK